MARKILFLTILALQFSNCSSSNGKIKEIKGDNSKSMTKSNKDPREKVIQLPPYDQTSSNSLIYALKHRKSQRKFDKKPLPLKMLSTLLWSANGINRKNGKRTAPVLWNMDIYVALQKGLYLYNPKDNSLELKLEKDIREKTGKQKFTQIAPVNLIFVMDYKNINDSWVESLGGKDYFAGNAVGYVSQNVYLFAAANNLSTVALAWFYQKELSTILKLKKSERILLTQPIGYGINVK
jgi:nitroreductase